jgi:hypothetical protein
LTVAALGLAAAGLLAQEHTPPPTPTPTAAAEDAKKEPIPFRPIESNVIINLPSVAVASKGTLTFLVTHRFQQRIQDGDINNFFTLDSENEWGFGLWYAPIQNLNLGFYRTSDLNVYEASMEYAFPEFCGFRSSLRVGEDWRTEEGVTTPPRSSFFAQAILDYDFGKYVRLTAVPTYLQRTNGYLFPRRPAPPGDGSCVELPIVPTPPEGPLFNCSGFYEDIFNVPVGLSIAITHSITVHGEVTPRLSKVNSSGVAWNVSVEKSLLRHRFAFVAGNQRQTTVDQYTGGVPLGRSPGNVYIGFNLYRAWKLN